MSQLQVTGEAKIRDIQGPVVANSGVITALDGAANQYVRGDGTLASFPTSGGGGSSVSYYLNGSVNQGTFAGSTYYEMGEDAITGTGTNFSTSTDGLLAQFITDAGVPDVTEIPSGNWNVEFFMGVSASSGALASFYVEIYKWDGSTFTLIATNAATPEFLTNTTTVDAYFTSVAMPTTTLAVTDRLAIRIYANVASKTVTLYTEDNRLCQVVTTFSKGILSLNNLTDQSQYLTTGTSGTNFNIDSTGDTHTFNLPVASATNTGKLSSTDWSTFNGKVPYTGANNDVDLGNYDFSADTITSKSNVVVSNNGGNAHALILQNGTGAYSSGLDSISLVSDIDNADALRIVSDIASVTKYASISLNLLSENTTRIYSLPNASGTIALLEGSQTFTGIKTFNLSTINETGIQLKNDIGIVPVVSGYTNLNGLTNGLAITNSSGVSNNLLVPATIGYSYTFPASSGTIALTSNLSSYVPYTGATGNLDLGNNHYYGGSILLKQSVGSVSATGYFSLSGSTGTGVGSLILGLGSGTTSSMNFPTSSNYSYVFPATSGTLALTSNLSAYLPLTGGTLTGALSGTSATFSGSVIVGTTALLNFGPTSNFVGMSGNNSTGTLALYANNAQALGFASTGAATFSSSVTAKSLKIENTSAASFLYFNNTAIPASNYIALGSAANDLYFQVNGSDRMVIKDNGNVGIGTSSPQTSLDIAGLNGNIRIYGRSGIADNQITSNVYYNGSAWVRDAGAYGAVAINLSSNGLITFNTTSSTSGFPDERMRITSGGNVGIGNTGESIARLSVKADSNSNGGYGIITRNLSNTICFYVSNIGNYYFAGTNESDRRVKDNIKELDSVLDKIQLLKPSTFTYLRNNTETRGGFIAQEVKEVFPEFVSKQQNEDDIMGVDYNGMIAVLTKAIQEQQAQIEELKALIAAK